MNPHEQKRPKGRRFWRICRLYFRRFRIFLWTLLLLLLGCLVYLNQIGLPSFLKGPLLQRLRERGLELEFARLRLRWYEGIVAENVRFGRAGDSLSPELTLREVQLGLNFRALTHFQVQIDKLLLREGRFTWPFDATNGVAEAITVNKIQTELRFLPDDQWSLDHFKAEFAGARLQLSGIVTNASAARQWSFFHGQRTEPASTGRWQNRMQRVGQALNRITFSAIPELRLDLRGDARELQSFSVLMILAAPGAQTPWGQFAEGRFTARVFAADTNGASRAELGLEAADAQTPWAAAQKLRLGLKLLANESETNLVHGDIQLAAAAAQTQWASATNISFSGSWVHALNNPVPQSGTGALSAEFAATRWGGARQVSLKSELVTPPLTSLPACDDSWGWWTNLHPYALKWQFRAIDLNSPKLELASIEGEGEWKAPLLNIHKLRARLYGGSLSAAGGLDVLTRFTQVTLESDFDPQQIKPLLPEAGRRWLEQYEWDGPPKVKGTLEVVLPAWTKRQPDWPREVQPTLQLSGEFQVPGGSHRGIHVDSARSHFIYSNLTWRLPDLVLKRPEGVILAEHRADERTKDFYWRIHSDVDVRIARPLLDVGAQRGLDLVSFTNPPVIDCELRGRFHEPEQTVVQGEVALTNFAFRGLHASSLQTSLTFSNGMLQFFHPQILKDTELARADGLLVDFDRQLVFLTNGFSTMSPMTVATAIGAQVAKVLAPYQFEKPPVAHVYGTIPMRGEEDADLHFDLAGGPFSWWKFHVPRIAAKLHWKGLGLTLTNAELTFYGGRAQGSAEFAFPRNKPGTEFQFRVQTTNTLLQALMADLSSSSNHLEGIFSGSVAVTRANSENWESVFGYGDLDLRDGLIWDIPLFGIFTPVLNGISPGLGNSRAGAATCSFTITNGVVRSDDLEIRSPALRLQYRGTVDFESRLNARVEAEVLRDVWLVGPLVSTMLWPVTKMFEYKLGGTLGEPKTEPVYIIPKLMLMPFHPFRTLKTLLPPEAGAKTNAPPVYLRLPDQPN